MADPKVSVLMSVHNGEKYLREAVESILTQTFKDFEFLVIDDASTDRSPQIVQSFDDPRIKLLRNDARLGLTRSLNIGIGLARGEYIARMDADDVSVPERLGKQVAFLDEHPSCSVVAARAAFMDESGQRVADWAEDWQTTTSQEIYRRLPKTNCVAHPTTMLRSSIAKEYRYSENQLFSQDHDLWLRLCADGKSIEKIDEPLLRYRVHHNSITYLTNQGDYEWKPIKTRLLYLKNRVKALHLNGFDLTVGAHTVKDIVMLGARRSKNFVKRRVYYVLSGIKKRLKPYGPGV
ncbi:MAG TPA: glycosyltransferase family 2 protein [Pyrinomonadaceae bacterium]|jgi:glycosyltransferase involved in cell wall biosynthesis|nr:glycosyltransferase family 2 protein [Pyrinomonadaceae bacterium]